MKPVKAAVIGMGIFGNVHAATYSHYGRTELAGVSELDPDRAQAAQDKYGCPVLTNDEIAADNSIEIVSIATPDHLHRDIAIQMIDAGKHILMEKPLTTVVSEAEEILAAAEKRGIRFMTDFQNRWNPPFVAAKEAIDNGELGDPVMITARLANTIKVPLEFLRRWSGQSGPEWFLFPHIVDLVRWLVNQEPRRVFAYGKKEILKAQGVDAYDAIQAQVIFDRCTAVFETAWIMPNNMTNRLEFRVDYLGSKGRFTSTPHDSGIEISGTGGSYIPFIGGWQNNHGRMAGFFQEPIMHFVDCVIDGKPMLTEPEDGLVVTKTVAAILKSVETGEIVHV